MSKVDQRHLRSILSLFLIIYPKRRVNIYYYCSKVLILSNKSLQNSSSRISRLIDQGEGEMLDFKKEISSTHRIAKSIVSFANHHGGTLLVGVNDNGTIAGVKAAEETYMLEQAAFHFCEPPIELEVKEWTLKGKVVLEVLIAESTIKPHFAIDEQGKKWVYVRHKDQSLLASKVLVEVLKQKSSDRPTLLKYSSMDRRC